MGLLQNISLKNAEPYDRIGDTTEMWVQTLVWSMNKYVNEAYMTQKSGVPDGFTAPYCYQNPIKEGGMSSFSLVAGSGGVRDTSYLSTAKAMLAALHKIEGFGEVRQSGTSLSLLVKFLCELGKIVGSGEISDTSIMTAFANLSAPSGKIEGFGQIETSPLNVIAWCSNVLTPIVGEGNIEATLKGWADMSANITSEGDLVTAQSCAAAVWSAVASSYNVSGTMGAKLNSAASGGVDYQELAEAVLDAEVSGRSVGSLGKTAESTLAKANMIPGLY